MKLLSPRISGALHYLSGAALPHHWKFPQANCPLCGATWFLALRDTPFMTRCLRCRSNITNLSLIPVIKQHFNENYTGKTAYELSSYGCVLTWLKNNFSNVTASEFFPNRPFGILVNGILNQDVQRLTFADHSFDVVTSNQVFEHVADDIQGFRECYRVLKPCGSLIFTVPWFKIQSTERIAVLEDSEVTFLGEPEYHDSRTTGSASVPVFWHHSVNDITDRIMDVGFRSAKLIDVLIAGIPWSASTVLYAIK